MTRKAGSLTDAVEAIGQGKLVVYPTETVYGLGADALDPVAINRVFDAKQRSKKNPVSLALPTTERVREFVEVSEVTRSFMEVFLPGPITVICPKSRQIPDVLTGGRKKVGVRVPDHELARRLLDRAAPVTATSANISGHEAVTRVTDLESSLLASVELVLDGGVTDGGVSTVVDPDDGVIHRYGREADAVEKWVETQ